MSRLENGSGWLKRNIPAVVTWVLIALTAAGTVGATSVSLSEVKEDVTDLKARSAEAVVDRASIHGDLRVNAEQRAAIVQRLDRFERTVDRLEVAARRLEAITESMRRGGD